MEQLSITARLEAPIILGGGYLTLDALLASLIFEDSGDIDIAHNSVPLACTDGLFHASAALIEPFASNGVSFVANLRAMHALDPDLIMKNRRGKIHKKIGLTRRRDFGAVMNSYTAFDAPDREGCLEVLVGASIGQVEISLDCLFSCGAVPSALDQNRVNGFSVFRPET